MGTLEQEIKQSVFQNQVHKGFLNIVYTANWLRDRTVALYKPHGILPQHYNILRIVRGKKGEATSPGQIIDVMLDKGRDLTRLVDKLVKMGYLERRTCPTNRRKVDIFITDIGLEITKIIEEGINQWFESTIGLSEPEALKLNELLDKLRG